MIYILANKHFPEKEKLIEFIFGLSVVSLILISFLFGLGEVVDFSFNVTLILFLLYRFQIGTFLIGRTFSKEFFGKKIDYINILFIILAYVIFVSVITINSSSPELDINFSDINDAIPILLSILFIIILYLIYSKTDWEQKGSFIGSIYESLNIELNQSTKFKKESYIDLTLMIFYTFVAILILLFLSPAFISPKYRLIYLILLIYCLIIPVIKSNFNFSLSSNRKSINEDEFKTALRILASLYIGIYIILFLLIISIIYILFNLSTTIGLTRFFIIGIWAITEIKYNNIYKKINLNQITDELAKKESILDEIIIEFKEIFLSTSPYRFLFIMFYIALLYLFAAISYDLIEIEGPRVLEYATTNSFLNKENLADLFILHFLSREIGLLAAILIIWITFTKIIKSKLFKENVNSFMPSPFAEIHIIICILIPILLLIFGLYLSSIKNNFDIDTYNAIVTSSVISQFLILCLLISSILLMPFIVKKREILDTTKENRILWLVFIFILFNSFYMYGYFSLGSAASNLLSDTFDKTVQILQMEVVSKYIMTIIILLFILEIKLTHEISFISKKFSIRSINDSTLISKTKNKNGTIFGLMLFPLTILSLFIFNGSSYILNLSNVVFWGGLSWLIINYSYFLIDLLGLIDRKRTDLEEQNESRGEKNVEIVAQECKLEEFGKKEQEIVSLNKKLR